MGSHIIVCDIFINYVFEIIFIYLNPLLVKVNVFENYLRYYYFFSYCAALHFHLYNICVHLYHKINFNFNFPTNKHICISTENVCSSHYSIFFFNICNFFNSSINRISPNNSSLPLICIR